MKNTVKTFAKMKAAGEKISMLTCYDYTTAKLEEAAGINAILVGDSLGNVMLGYPDTLSVTMEDMITYGRAVARACHDTMVVIDMPFMSYQVSVSQAVENAGRLMKEGRANAVKLEGGAAVCAQIDAITAAGIPVMAHLGMTPQSVNAFGGNRVQGRTEDAAQTSSRTRKPSSARAPSPSSSSASPRISPPASRESSPSRPSASARATPATGRSSSTWTCSACSATTRRNSSSTSRSSAKR